MPKYLRLLLPLAVLFTAACAQEQPTRKPPPVVGMANPASVYCGSLGGKSVIQSGNNGQWGLCQLPDGKQIEEWELFRRDHLSKDAAGAGAQPAAVGR